MQFTHRMKSRPYYSHSAIMVLLAVSIIKSIEATPQFITVPPSMHHIFGRQNKMYSAIIDNHGEYKAIDFFLRRNQYKKERELIVFDVGGWKGQWGYYVLKKCPTAHVFAFEPTPASFLELEKNWGEFDKETYTLSRYALARQNGTNTFATYIDSSVNSLYQHKIVHKCTTIEVNTKTLDSFCTEHNIETIDFLKLDVEGAELDIFLGAQRMLSEKRIPMIQFEYSVFTKDAKSSLKQLYGMLTKYGYRISRIKKSSFQPLPKWNNKLEDYKWLNYLAVLPDSPPKR